MERIEAFELIDAERAYQERKWGPTATAGLHTVEEFFVYIEDYPLSALEEQALRNRPGLDPATAP